ncbi:MAG: hypothetical protein ACKOPM_08800 [Novosphingobium sp.]
MLNDPDAVRVSGKIAECFAAIAACEQDLHQVRRSAAADVDGMLHAIEVDLKAIEAAMEGILIDDAVWFDLPSMDVTTLFPTLDAITLPLGAHPADPTDMANWLAPYLVRAQCLDAWLEPSFNREMDLDSIRAEFRDAFSIDGAITLPDGALLLPRSQSSWRGDIDGDSQIGLFARNLRGLAYVPAQLQCDDPDDLCQPGAPIRAEYRLWNSAVFQSKPLPENPVIAVAPLAECGSDVAFVPSACRTKYALKLAYDEQRFAKALARALEQGVHILLVPEMALPEGDPADFDQRMQQLFLDVRADHFARTGRVDELRLVLAGVLGGVRDDGFHRNYAVAFDADGEQPTNFRQLKLSHWNLNQWEQGAFGITHYQSGEGPLADPIFENSRPADSLVVLDIPGIGRTATLICADMSQNNPGDWLGVNAVLDWLYAPIMDKSICWMNARSMGKGPPWIVTRSYRSARLTGTIVISTNSLSLSRWMNEENRRSASAWPQYSQVGIGLAIDGRADHPRHDHVLVGINSRDVLAKFASPASSWGPVAFI